MTLTYTAAERNNGTVLLNLLKHEMEMSASLIRRLKRVQGIYVNGKPVYTNYVVAVGDVITADLAAAEPPCDIVPETGDIDIIFENEGLLAVNKPSGVIVHPSHSRYDGTLANFVAGYLEKTTGSAVCHAVNRLDRDTSGVVLFAKNSHYKSLACRALTTAEKEYVALVFGTFKEPKGTVDLPIKRLQEQNLLRVVSPDGQDAITHYETLKAGVLDDNRVSLVRFRLETGRTHQIRVHCLASGTPVLGDTLYYTDSSKSLSELLDINSQALHAYRLTFKDPISREILSLTAPLLRLDMCKIISSF